MSLTGDDYFTILSPQADSALLIVVDEGKPTIFFVILHVTAEPSLSVTECPGSLSEHN